MTWMNVFFVDVDENEAIQLCGRGWGGVLCWKNDGGKFSVTGGLLCLFLLLACLDCVSFYVFFLFSFFLFLLSLLHQNETFFTTNTRRVTRRKGARVKEKKKVPIGAMTKRSHWLTWLLLPVPSSSSSSSSSSPSASCFLSFNCT